MKNLLSADDPAPCGIENPESTSPLLFVSDHAGRVIPRALGDLGLDEAELSRHIGYDIGIYGVTTRVARALPATYIFQRYSRLVIDCNRQPGKPQSIAESSDTTVVPANAKLSREDADARSTEILVPYQQAIGDALRQRAAAGRLTVLVAMHSCTERLRSDGKWRPWEIAVIAESDWRYGHALIDVLRERTSFTVGVNEPYRVNMEMDYTVPIHAEGKGIPYVEIEVRQDLISDEAGQERIAEILTPLFPLALERSRLVGA